MQQNDTYNFIENKNMKISEDHQINSGNSSYNGKTKVILDQDLDLSFPSLLQNLA